MGSNDRPAKTRRSLFNVFDIVVLLVIAALAFFLFTHRSDDTSAVVTTQEVRYTIELPGMINGTAQLIKPGDHLADRIKKYNLGVVADVDVVPTERLSENRENGEQFITLIPGEETAFVTVAAQAVVTDTDITVDNGMIIRVGTSVTLKGPGYFANGTIVSIDRDGLEAQQ